MLYQLTSLLDKRVKCYLCSSFFFPPEFSRSLLPRARRLLLLVNPFSGRGQAMQWCQTHILPMIKEANISYNLIQTGNTKAVIIICREHPRVTCQIILCLRTTEPCPRADQRNLATRVGWHCYRFWRWPTA